MRMNQVNWERQYIKMHENGDLDEFCELGDKVRFELIKKIRDYLEIFPNMGGGVFPIPKTQNKKKPLNHSKITQKTI